MTSDSLSGDPRVGDPGRVPIVENMDEWGERF